MTEILGVRIPLTPWFILPVIIMASLILAYLINTFILWAMKKTAALRRISRDAFERIYSLTERYLFFLLFVVIVKIAVDALPLPPKVLASSQRLLIFSGLLLGVFFLTKAALVILGNMESRYEPLRNIKGPIELALKIVFIAVGAMIILDNLGISLTPILTTLGVGSLAVAIALQDTLGNFFAGLYIKADRPIELGHFVRLESGEEGYVEHIGWRNTRIRMLPNNMVIVPNSKITQSIITNYYLPDKELAVLVDVGVDYRSDLEKVERVTCQVAKEVLESVPGGVTGFSPFIRYHTFGESSINLTVILRAREFVDNFLIKHEFIKKLSDRYKKEGITIPFPIRSVHLEDGDRGLRQRLGTES